MKEKILELVGEKLTQINDVKQQVDILQYMVDIDFFNSKISEYMWLSNKLPKKYHDLKIGELVYLDLKELRKRIGVFSNKKINCDRLLALSDLLDMYSIVQYTYYLNNSFKLLDKFTDDSFENSTKGQMLAKTILDYMRKSDVLFNAGVALFHDDENIRNTSRQYLKK